MSSSPIYDRSGAAAQNEQGGVARKMVNEALGLFDRGFGALATALILAVIVTVPLLQFFALGYMLHAAGRYAKTGKFSEAFPGVRQFSRIGQFVLGVWLTTLPPRVTMSMRADALLIAGGTSPQVKFLSSLTYGLGIVAGLLALISLSQGGGFIHFIRPLRGTRRFFKQARETGYLSRTKEAIKHFVEGFGVPKIFSIGVRGYVGAGIWLAIPTTMIAIGRNNILALFGGALLVAVLVYLPFLQIHFVVHDRFKRMFDLHGIRFMFQRAPLAFFFAFLSTLLLALPLYLLKVEVVPRQALWLPAAVFLLTIFPCKLLTAWAYHRAAKRGEDKRHAFWQWSARLAMVPVAVYYAFVVFLTQYTGWHGVLGLYEHHAFLLPVPF